MSLHTIGIGHMRIYGDTFRYAQLREMCGRWSLAMEMEIGDDSKHGGAIAAWILQTPNYIASYYTANVTRAACASN